MKFSEYSWLHITADLSRVHPTHHYVNKNESSDSFFCFFFNLIFCLRFYCILLFIHIIRFFSDVFFLFPFLLLSPILLPQLFLHRLHTCIHSQHITWQQVSVLFKHSPNLSAWRFILNPARWPCLKENKKKRHRLAQFSLFPSSTTVCLGDKRVFFHSGSFLTPQRITSRIILSLHLFPLKTNNKAAIIYPL